jgi:hypothetical protein
MTWVRATGSAPITAARASLGFRPAAVLCGALARRLGRRFGGCGLCRNLLGRFWRQI